MLLRTTARSFLLIGRCYQRIRIRLNVDLFHRLAMRGCLSMPNRPVESLSGHIWSAYETLRAKGSPTNVENPIGLSSPVTKEIGYSIEERRSPAEAASGIISRLNFPLHKSFCSMAS